MRYLLRATARQAKAKEFLQLTKEGKKVGDSFYKFRQIERFGPNSVVGSGAPLLTRQIVIDQCSSANRLPID